MSIKRILLLAGMALAAMAFPASAMAVDTITDNGALKDKTIHFLGTAEFNTLGSGIKCPATANVTVDGDTVVVTNFSVPTVVGCTFFGNYAGCEFEENPTAVSNIPVDLVTSGTELRATITGGSLASHSTINSELKNCFVTTQDLTLVHNASTGVTADVETDGNGFITALKLTGTVRLDAGPSSEGTTTPHSTNNLLVGIGGTLHITETETYTYSGS
jgi:hypothetical protein